jgi:hypothetical protein
MIEPLLHWRESGTTHWYLTAFLPGLPTREAPSIYRVTLGDQIDPATGEIDTVDTTHILTRYIAGTAAEFTTGLLGDFVQSVLSEWDRGVRDATSPLAPSRSGVFKKQEHP